MKISQNYKCESEQMESHSQLTPVFELNDYPPEFILPGRHKTIF